MSSGVRGTRRLLRAGCRGAPSTRPRRSTPASWSSSADRIHSFRRRSGTAIAASSRTAFAGRTRWLSAQPRATSTPTSGRRSLADVDRQVRRRAGARHLERALLRETDRPGEDGLEVADLGDLLHVLQPSRCVRARALVGHPQVLARDVSGGVRLEADDEERLAGDVEVLARAVLGLGLVPGDVLDAGAELLVSRLEGERDGVGAGRGAGLPVG